MSSPAKKRDRNDDDDDAVAENAKEKEEYERQLIAASRDFYSQGSDAWNVLLDAAATRRGNRNLVACGLDDDDAKDFPCSFYDPDTQTRYLVPLFIHVYGIGAEDRRDNGVQAGCELVDWAWFRTPVFSALLSGRVGNHLQQFVESIDKTERHHYACIPDMLCIGCYDTHIPILEMHVLLSDARYLMSYITFLKTFQSKKAQQSVLSGIQADSTCNLLDMLRVANEYGFE